MSCARIFSAIVGVGVVLTATAGTPAAAQQVYEAFESAETSWHVGPRDCGLRVAKHQRTFREAHSFPGSEYLRLVAGAGTYVHLSHQLPHCLVIEDLELGIWVRSSQPGISVLCRVVFPRSIDPLTGQPLEGLLQGEVYRDVGQWRRLTLSRIDRLTLRCAQRIRTERELSVTVEGAYIDQLLVNAYGGRGTTQLWLDDLEIQGRVSREPGKSPATSASAPDFEGVAAGTVPQLDAGILKIADVPLLPRVIEHRGESLGYLAKLGFNLVALDHLPSDGELGDAEQFDLWLIAPCPLLPQVPSPPTPGAGAPGAGAGLASEAAQRAAVLRQHPRILAWSTFHWPLLHESAAGEAFSSRSAARLAAARRAGFSPLVATAHTGPWEVGRHAEVLLAGQPVLGTDQPLTALGTHVREAIGAGRLTVACWGRVESQCGTPIREQVEALGGPLALNAAPEQLQVMAWEAFAAGARGLWVTSAERLDADSAPAHLRSAALRSLNLELKLLQPWLAGDVQREDLPVTPAWDRITLLNGERAQLTLFRRIGHHQQLVAGPPPAAPLVFRADLGSSTPQLFLMRDDHLQRLDIAARQPGGHPLSVALDRATGTLVTSQDPLTLGYLSRQLQARQATYLDTQRAVLFHSVGVLAETAAQLPDALRELVEQQYLAEARALIRTCDEQRKGERYGDALAVARRGIQLVAEARRATWERLVAEFPSPRTSPSAVNFAALARHAPLSERIARGTWGENLIREAELESMDAAVAAGWRLQGIRPGDPGPPEITSSAPGFRSPRCLQLRVPQSDQFGTGAPRTEGAVRAYIATGPVPVRRGRLLRISGWVKVAPERDSTPSPLIVYDSLNGIALGESFRSHQWRQFVHYRAVPRDGLVSVQFALAGSGCAWVDQVSVQVLEETAAPAGDPRQPSARLTAAPGFRRSNRIDE